MKRLLLSVLMTTWVLMVSAIPAKPGLKRMLTLNDGSRVEARLVGDEHGHFWLSKDGRAFMGTSRKNIYKLIGDEQLKQLKADALERRTEANENRMARMAQRRVGDVGSSYFGKKRGLIILVNFSDVSFERTHTNALFERIANERGYSEGKFYGSMYDYFYAQSMGQFEFLKDRLVLVNGVAKGYAMTGWRIGYIAAPQAIVKATNKIQGQITSGICTIAQAAAAKAMELSPENSKEIQDMLAAFRHRRDTFVKLLNEIPGVKCNTPAGAFYVFPEMKSFYGKTDGETVIKGSDDLCMWLLYNAHVACVAGNAFGNDDCIRLSYATSEDKLIEAVRRIKAALAKLH